MKTFYQGDTVRFCITGQEGLDLDGVDFQVSIYPSDAPRQSLRIQKQEMTPSEEGTYQGAIACASTKNLSIGIYMIELLLRQASGDVCIAKSEAFRLEESVSKHDVQ